MFFSHFVVILYILHNNKSLDACESTTCPSLSSCVNTDSGAVCRCNQGSVFDKNGKCKTGSNIIKV